MTGTLAALAVASGLFVASHLLLAVPPVRSSLVARLGERGFQALYSVLALALLAWVVLAYKDAPVVDLWFPPVAMRHLSLIIMPFACIFVVAGMTTPNPSAIGSNPPSAVAGPVGILKITRHPVMCGFAFWGVAHLLSNGDAAGCIFFGTLTILAVIGPFAQDAKKRTQMGEAWLRYQRQTSLLPFAALALGRTRMRLGEIGWQRIGGGLALYAGLLAAHPWLFGVSPLRSVSLGANTSCAVWTPRRRERRPRRTAAGAARASAAETRDRPVQGLAQAGQTGDLVRCGPDDGEIEPLLDADVAITDVADVQCDAEGERRLGEFAPRRVQVGETGESILGCLRSRRRWRLHMRGCPPPPDRWRRWEIWRKPRRR